MSAFTCSFSFVSQTLTSIILWSTWNDVNNNVDYSYNSLSQKTLLHTHIIDKFQVAMNLSFFIEERLLLNIYTWSFHAGLTVKSVHTSKWC